VASTPATELPRTGFPTVLVLVIGLGIFGLGVLALALVKE
jgi:LPXTG-motif cell wall-anchored protein